MGLITPILVGPQARIEAVAAQAGIDIAGLEIVDAPHSHGLGRDGGAPGARGQGRDADEGQPAHRRADGRGGQARHRPAHRAAHQPLLRHGRAGASTAWSSSPTRRSTSSRRWRTRSTSCRTRSTWPMRWACEQPKVAILSAMETVNPQGAVDDRGRGAVQDGRARPDHRRPARRPAGARQRHRPRARRGSRRSRRRWPGRPTSWWCPTSRPATCWPRA